MNYKYTGTHKDTRAVHGVGEVSAGTVIAPLDKAHEERIKASGLFETTKEKPKAEEVKRSYSVKDVKAREATSLGEAAQAEVPAETKADAKAEASNSGKTASSGKKE